MTNSEIIVNFEEIFKEDDYSTTSRLHFAEFSEDRYANVIVSLYGGMNGWGEWKDYLYDLYELINALNSRNIDVYIIEFDIDVLDDVFKVTMKLKDGTNKIEESES